MELFSDKINRFNIYKLSQKAKHPPFSTLCDRDIRISFHPSLFLLAARCLKFCPFFSLFLFIFLLLFHFVFVSLSQRIHQILSERVAGCYPGREGVPVGAGWLVGSLLQLRSLTYLSPLLGREIESVFFAMLHYSPIQLHLIVDSFTGLNPTQSKINQK